MPSITPAQRRAYQKKIADIIKKANGLDEISYKRMVNILSDFQKRLANEIREQATPGLNRMTVQQMNAIDIFLKREIPKIQATLISALNGVQSEAWNLGNNLAIETLASVGLNIGAVPVFSPEQFQIATEISADLIKGINNDMLGKINLEIRTAVLGEKNVYETMKRVDDVLGLTAQGKTTSGGVTYRAERIVRTETNRAFNLANRVQVEKLSQQIKGLKHAWVAEVDQRTREEHIKADDDYNPDGGGQAIPVDEPFVVGGEKLMYPGDPAGSAWNVINCRCREVIITDDIEEEGVTSTIMTESFHRDCATNCIDKNIISQKSLYRRMNVY